MSVTLLGTKNQIKYANDLIKKVKEYKEDAEYKSIAKRRILETIESFSGAKDIIENQNALDIRNFVRKAQEIAKEWSYTEYPNFRPNPSSWFYGRHGTPFDKLCQEQRREIEKHLHNIWSEDLSIINRNWDENYWIAKTDEFWWGLQPMGDDHGYVQIDHRQSDKVSRSGFPPLEALRSIALAIGAESASERLRDLIEQVSVYNNAVYRKFIELLENEPVM